MPPPFSLSLSIIISVFKPLPLHAIRLYVCPVSTLETFEQFFAKLGAGYTLHRLQPPLYYNFSLQNEHHPKPAAPKAPTHNELRTRRPMW